MLSVVILNWKRPNNIKSLILPQLLKCNIVGEIIISHGLQLSSFTFNHPKVVHRNDHYLNIKYGLLLRFIAGISTKYPNILIMDDDIIAYPLTITNMYNVYKKNNSITVGRFGRKITNKYDYSCLDIDSKYTFAPIVLTSLVIINKKLCYTILEKCNQHPNLIEFVKTNSIPLWNGEDIFMSFISNKIYNKQPIITADPQLFPIKKLRSDNDLKVAISKTSINHSNYRSRLIKYLIRNL